LARDLQDRRSGLIPSLRKSPFLGPAFAQLDDTGLTDVRRNILHIALELAHRHLRQDSIWNWNTPDQVAKGDPAGHWNLAEFRMLLGGRLDRRLNGTRELMQGNRDRLGHLIFLQITFSREIILS
jgi:hypothetical protein